MNITAVAKAIVMTVVLLPPLQAHRTLGAERDPNATQGRAAVAALVEAAKKGDLKAVNAALAAGTDPNAQHHGYSALYWAAYHPTCSPDIVKRLIEAGGDVNAKNKSTDRSTPLMVAGTAEVVKILIEAGADVNAPIRGYSTILGRAPNVEIARLLIKAGADVNGGPNMSPLASAAQSGKVELIRLLVQQGARANVANYPPIHCAKSPEAAKALLEAGADPNQRNEKGSTALHFSHRLNADVIKVLLQAGADVNARDDSGSTPLHAAIRSGKPEVVKLLTEIMAAVNAKDQQGNTPLSLARNSHSKMDWEFLEEKVKAAATARRKELVQILKDAGATDDGKTPLQRAVATGRLDEVQRLIKSGADVNATGPKKTTALHIASEHGDVEVLAALLDAGAEVDTATVERLRPLHLAANSKIARRLIESGAEVDAGGEQISPLYLAAGFGNADVVRELLRHEPNVEFNDFNLLTVATFAGRKEVVAVILESDCAEELLKVGDGQSALHVAACGGLLDTASPKWVTPDVRLEIARLLVEHGADVNSQPSVGHMKGTTPLMDAAGSGHTELVKYLLKKGADVNASTSGRPYAGQTALHSAARWGHGQVVQLLLEAKADVNALTKKPHWNGIKTPLDLAKDGEIKSLLINYGGRSASELREK